MVVVIIFCILHNIDYAKAGQLHGCCVRSIQELVKEKIPTFFKKTET